MAPSFERLDYLLRANKNIERKLIFDVLLHSQRLVSEPLPTYLGFGSMWFADFRLAHRLLALQTMVSIERTAYAERADYNKPYDSISIRPGECLPVMRNFTEKDWRSRVFAWLDFDGLLNRDVARVIDLFLGNCAVDSVLVLTVNGMRKRYARERVNNRREDTSVGYVEKVLGATSVDPRFQVRLTGGGKHEDVDDSMFPELLADALLSFMVHKTRVLARERSGKRVSFVPLFNLCHEDGASMVTAGGAIADEETAPFWRKCLEENTALLSENGLPLFQMLNLVPITLKEKLALDACLPQPARDFLSRAQSLGLRLSDEQIEKYRLFNRHFPVFVESPI